MRSATTQANTCDDPVPTLRTYTGFAQAAAEYGLSRVYIGWHFRSSVEPGLERTDGEDPPAGEPGPLCTAFDR
jgi:hypothetical protein